MYTVYAKRMPPPQTPAAARDPRLLRLRSWDSMMTILKENGTPLAQFSKGDTIYVWNKMRKGYSYRLDAAPGDRKSWPADFRPAADPGEILALGAFGGRYLNDCVLEFPAEWFWRAGLLGKLAPEAPLGGNIELNALAIDSRLPLDEWRTAGWVPGGKRLTGARAVLSDPARNPDERGWFQWYCRYWMGRRIPELDTVQIQRWRNFRRHYGAVKGACAAGDLTCRPRQRQALLHWAWPWAD